MQYVYKLSRGCPPPAAHAYNASSRHAISLPQTAYYVYMYKLSRWWCPPAAAHAYNASSLKSSLASAGRRLELQ